MKEKFRLTEVWFKFALLVVFSAFYLLALPFPELARQFPQMLAVLSIALTVIALGLDFTRKQAVQGEISDVDDTELKVVDEDSRRFRRKRYYQTWAIILVSTGVGFLIGFLFSALCLLAGFALVFGTRDKLTGNLIIAVVTTLLVYLVFGMLMQVPLVGGILW